jgi:hypothetical protein
MAYSFGYSSDEIDIPELDAFLTDMRSVCERHGIGFEWEHGWGEDGSKLLVVPFERAEWDFFFEHLDDYEGGISFLDAAKEAWNEKREKRREAEEAAQSQRHAAARAAHEAALKREGVTLSDGRYRLVKD